MIFLLKYWRIQICIEGNKTLALVYLLIASYIRESWIVFSFSWRRNPATLIPLISPDSHMLIAHWSTRAGYRKMSSADNRMFWSLKLQIKRVSEAEREIQYTCALVPANPPVLQVDTRLRVSTCRLNTTGNTARQSVLTCTATFNDLWCFARRILPVLPNSDSVISVPATSFFEHSNRKKMLNPAVANINETMSNPPPDWIQWQ